MPMSAGRRVPGEPLLSPALLLRAMRARGPAQSTNVRLFAYARHALARIVEEGSVTGGVLYAPSYICTEATLPLRAIGQEVRYYPVRSDLEPDWDWLEGDLDSRARALILVHYFGFPNAIDDAQDFVRRHGLLLIEDCAHSFLTRHVGQVIGTIGDAGIYSYRKMLPLPNGAGLITKGGEEDPPGAPRMGNYPYREILKQLVKHGLHTRGVPGRMWGWVARGPSSSNGAYSGPDAGRSLPMAGICRRIMNALEPSFESIVSIRRGHYQHLVNGFSQFPEVTLPYPDLIEGVCPYQFPILLHDRERVLRELRASGIPCYTWPVLPDEVAAEPAPTPAPAFEVARRYANQVLTLPVHQDLKAAHVEEIIDSYRKVRRKVLERV